ncbi:MAG: FGGY family carbohydrate kinase [Ilumatobacteraceae bacterium]
MSVLVIDVGTSGIRAAVVDGAATITAAHHRQFQPSTPSAGLVEFDAVAMARIVLQVARDAIVEAGGQIEAVGITNQRASTVVWDRATGTPIGPAIGWQDLRTVFDCITARSEHGLHLAPNQSITKVAWLLNTFDPDRTRDLCFGTVDTWLAWVLTNGAVHVTDPSNAIVTGMLLPDASGWSERACAAFNVPPTMLPTLVDSSGVIGLATALPGSPPIAALAGDQQASLIGQSCVASGVAKITFGTGGIFDMCTDDAAPQTANRSATGTYPIAAWRIGGTVRWAREAIILSAGTCVEWLRDDLGIIATAAQSHDVASQCESTDGVMFVPALLGIGTPSWDYGARGMLIGLTRGSGRPQVVRAVLEGVAHRGADLVDAVEADAGPIGVLRIDGGMSENPTFGQALADATGKQVEVSPYAEATTLGAAYLAGLTTGAWSSLAEIGEAWNPRTIFEPRQSLDRARWADAVGRARGWIPDLSALDF